VTALTVSGDIEGLLRECSPVGFNVGGVDGVVVGFVHHKGTDNVPLVWWPRDYCGVGKPSYRSSVHLRLDHETGRAHAAWWLEEQAPSWLDEGGLWTLTCWHHIDWGHLGESSPVAHIDPNDPRPLEDGSRWVDAEALRLVVLHVAGRLP